MAINISPDIFILSLRDLDERERRAYLRGVERGRFEERVAIGNEQVAKNCAHWNNGICDHCGAQHQGCEVSFDFRCPHFQKRNP